MHKMGIDIQFMVEHVGGSYIINQDSDGDQDVESGIDFPDLESSESLFDQLMIGEQRTILKGFKLKYQFQNGNDDAKQNDNR